MHPPHRSIVAALAIIAACSSSSTYPHLAVVEAFVVPPTVHTNAAITTTSTSSSSSTMLLSSANAPGSKETEAERLLRRARELRNEVRSNEDELHATLISRKNTRDACIDAIISRLFPDDNSRGVGENDARDGPKDEGAMLDLCDRLREMRLAADVLVSVVERLHEIEVRAMGLEHVEPTVHHDRVAFVRVARPDDVELDRVRGCVDMLIRAAMVLDEEFMKGKETECDGRITHSDIVHWGGGNIAGMLKDKANDLGRAHDEQFQKRLESFYDAAKRKHTRDEFDRDSWRDGDVWSP